MSDLALEPLLTPRSFALAADLRENAPTLLEFEFAQYRVRILEGRDDVWAVIGRAGCSASVVQRLVHCPGGLISVRALEPAPDGRFQLCVDCLLGEYEVVMSTDTQHEACLRVTVTLQPRQPVALDYMPRDLFVLGVGDEPGWVRGGVEATQRGLNAGVCYFRLDEPAFGTVLYFQDFTSLADYFNQTGTSPEGAVGGQWPELGFRLPTALMNGQQPNEGVLSKKCCVSDSYLVLHESLPKASAELARLFVSMLGTVYRQVTRPAVEYRDWESLARKTIHDLNTSPKASITHYGHKYAHPYTDSEYPDSMVQISLISALHDYGNWADEPVPLEDLLARGVRKFFDPELGSFRRYLPNVGDDKDADAVDSWYLFHPLLNLTHLAIDGDDRAEALLRDTLDFGIKAAHHFGYNWPIQFNIKDFSIITKARDEHGLGQTDVNGLYAFLMSKAFELFREPMYLNEARVALDVSKDMRFDLQYQANLTAWGAAACQRLWRITNDNDYLQLGYTYLASFFHNSIIWESEIGHAQHYSTFLGATCLHDAPYMAIFECFDSFTAFQHYLTDGGDELDAGARLLVAEYCRYALHRAWFYYPSHLPKEAIATDNRNGHIDAELAFPVEDLYADGKQAGQVGQEIYGAGAALVFATRSIHRVDGAPFDIYCDQLEMRQERVGPRSVEIAIHAVTGTECLLALVWPQGSRKTTFLLRDSTGKEIAATGQEERRTEFRLATPTSVTLSW